MRLRPAPRTVEPRAEAVAAPEPEPDSWSVRYTAVMDDGAERVWEQTFEWESADKFRGAGNALLAQKVGTAPLIIGGKLYPPHRLESVTWELL